MISAMGSTIIIWNTVWYLSTWWKKNDKGYPQRAVWGQIFQAGVGNVCLPVKENPLSYGMYHK